MVEVLNNKLSLGGYVPHKPSREIDLKEDNEDEAAAVEEEGGKSLLTLLVVAGVCFLFSKVSSRDWWQV